MSTDTALAALRERFPGWKCRVTANASSASDEFDHAASVTLFTDSNEIVVMGWGDNPLEAHDALIGAWNAAIRPTVERAVLSAIADAGRHAAKIADVYDAPDAHGITTPKHPSDTASAAILNDLCDPDDPDVRRIVARVLNEKEPTC